MKEFDKRKTDIMHYVENKDYIANIHVMRCFTVAMVVYLLTYILNALEIFIIDKDIMKAGFVPSVLIYLVVLIVTKCVSLSDRKVKYFILFGILSVFTIAGTMVTYHVVIVSLMPIVYATLYSSKKVMWYVYGLTVASTMVIVYGGYYWGLCDANMALLTSTKLENYVVDGVFEAIAVNQNPALTLTIFFVIPRCLLQVAFVVACNTVFSIIEDSFGRAAYIAQRENMKIQKAEMEREKAEEASKAKSIFLSSMSHEIRTPMNAIVGMTDVLLRGNHSKETTEYLNNIKVSGDALLTIINDILDFSKIESGKMNIVENKYKPRSMINDMKLLFENRTFGKQIELIYHVDDDIPEMLYGDEHRLRQVIINLVNNAIKFTDTGYVKLILESKTIDENKVELSFKVKDTGIGIRQEELPKIFGSYAQVDVEKNHFKEGTGLGLAISKQLVNLMNGSIGVESQYGEGSTFYFTVPQIIVADTSDDEAYDDASETNSMTFIAPKAHILVVDDNEMNIKVIKALLEPFNLCIDIAVNGKEALDMVTKYTYDLVFMDHMMPVMDGIEATNEIRKLEGECYSTLPIIALTANVTEEARELFLKEQMNDFVAKPIRSVELKKCLLRWLPKDLIEVQIEDVDTKSDKEIKDNTEILPVIDGLNVEEGIRNCGSKKLFLELIQDFYKLIDSKSLTIEKFLEEGMIRDYTIEVHALKNVARMIGATELSELAYELEKLGNENDTEQIELKTPELLQRYRGYKTVLEEYGKTKSQNTTKVSYSQMKSTLMRVHDAMDNFDLDEADKAMAELETYEFADDIKEMLEELRVYLADVAMEDVIKITEAMCDKLEEHQE